MRASWPAPLNLRFNCVSLFTPSLQHRCTEIVTTCGRNGYLLEGDKVTGFGQSNGLERALCPGDDLILDGLLGLEVGAQVLGLLAREDDLLGVAQDDAGEANLLEPRNRPADLDGVLAGAELGVKRLLEEEPQQRVLIRVEDRVAGVGEDVHDAQRGGQQPGRRGDGGGGQGAQDGGQGQHGERCPAGGGHVLRVGDGGGLGDGVGPSLRGVDVALAGGGAGGEAASRLRDSVDDDGSDGEDG